MKTITKEYVEKCIGFKISSFTQKVIRKSPLTIEVDVVPVKPVKSVTIISNIYLIQINDGEENI